MTTKSIQSGIKILLLIIIFTASQYVHAQQQAVAGPDKTICKGESIILGGSMNPAWCFHWTPYDGLSNPRVANPVATPDSTITYNLTVTGEEYSFISSATVTITVVEISDITFSVEPLPVGTGATSLASATSTSGDPVEWSIIGNSLGASINSATGLITAGSQSGMITVRATDSNKPECDNEAILCLGSGQECCPEYDNVIKTWGPITANINGQITPIGPADSDGYCTYSAPASINISMDGVFEKTYSIPGVTVSWKEKANDPSDFKDVTISWTGSYTAGTFGVIDANVVELSLTINSQGNLSGTVTFEALLNQDKNLGGIAILRSGLSGTFTYSYTTGGPSIMGNSGSGFAGQWDFNGVTGFHVDLVKGNSVIASVTVQSFDANGNINNAELTAATPAVWTTNHFTATLDQLSLEFNYSISENEIEFIGGTGQVSIGNITNVQGDITLGLTFTDTDVNATVTLSDAKAFSCTVTGTLSVDFTYDFDLQTIAGNDISAKHDDFDQSFTDVEFEIKDAALEKFGIGQITVKYKEKIEFSMTNAMYSKSEGTLQFNAKVVLPSIQMEVTEFKIDNAGVVTVGSLTANINQSPVSLEIDIGWSTDQFQGTFNGQFAGGFAINGSIVIGATATFNYGHFSLYVATPGLPLGNSGLQIKTLAGEFGYNWRAPDKPNASSGPELGTTTIGFGIGIADIADLMLVEGYIQLILGAATQINLKGAVKVTANPPHYFMGQLDLYYQFGSETLSGSISSSINFPPSTGNVVRINTGNVLFGVGDGGSKIWYVESQTMTGSLFNTIDVSSRLELWGPLSHPGPGIIRGNISGSLDWDYTFSYAYPPGFDASTDQRAYETSNSLGFGIKGTLELELRGSFTATMNEAGLSGTLQGQASASCVLSVRWPGWLWGGTVYHHHVSAEGSLTIEKTTGGGRVHGEVTYRYQNEAETGEIDFSI